jgi:hypothetical protein
MTPTCHLVALPPEWTLNVSTATPGHTARVQIYHPEFAQRVASVRSGEVPIWLIPV